MTLKKLSDSRLFFRLLQNECFRQAWAEGFILIVLILFLPVNMTLQMGMYTEQYVQMEEDVLVERMGSNFPLFALVFLLGVMMALVEFHYLFSRKKVDFYHSLPLSRTMQFWYRYFCGIVLFAVPFLVLYAIAVLVGILNGAMVVGYVSELTVLAGIYLLCFWLSYSVSIIAVQLAGCFLSCFVVMLLLHFGLPLLCLLLETCQDVFFETFVTTGKPLLYGYGGDATLCFKLLEDFGRTGYLENRLLFLLIAMAFLLPVTGYLFYLNRPSEKSGCGLAYPSVGFILRFAVCISAGLACGLILWSLSFRNSDFWLFFGTVAGAILFHFIMQMIWQMDFRGFFKGKRSLLFCTAFTVVLMCVFRYDLTGYDTYIPPENQIQSAGVGFSALESGYDYYVEYTSVYLGAGFSRVIETSSTSAGNPYEELMDMNLKSSDSILALMRGAIAEMDSGEDITYRYGSDMVVCFRLKNGNTIFRKYFIDLLENQEYCSGIFAMDNFKEQLYPILAEEETNTAIWLNRYSDDYYGIWQKLTLEDAQFTTFLRTYKRELQDMDYSVLLEEEPLLNIAFTDNLNHEYITYPIYPSFKHTLTLLKGYGYVFESLEDSLYKVQVIYEDPQDDDTDYLYYGVNEETASSSDSIYLTEDEEELDQLKPYLFSWMYYASGQTIQEEEPGYYVIGYLTDPATGEEIVLDFSIKKGCVPEFLKQLEEN